MESTEGKEQHISAAQQRLVKMETVVRSHKKIKLKNLVFEMFGGNRPTDVQKTYSTINSLRSKLKREKGEMFYSIGGFHQIITDESTFIALMEATKRREKGNVLTLKENMRLGIESFPGARQNALRIKGEIGKLLTNGDKHDTNS